MAVRTIKTVTTTTKPIARRVGVKTPPSSGKGKKALIVIVSLLAIGGVVGYFLWKRNKDKKEQERLDAEKKEADALALANQNQNQNTGGGTSGGATGNLQVDLPTLNFQQVQTNLSTKANANGVVSVRFNGNKNQADFYNNNRVIIGTVGQSGYLKKGTYSNGGKTIVLDGGKTITSGSVWQNLNSTLS